MTRPRAGSDIEIDVVIGARGMGHIKPPSEWLWRLQFEVVHNAII